MKYLLYVYTVWSLFLIWFDVKQMHYSSTHWPWRYWHWAKVYTISCYPWTFLSIQCITPQATGSFIQEMAQCYATDFRDIEKSSSFTLFSFHPVCIGEIILCPLFFLPFHCIILRPYLFIRWFNVTPMHYSLVQFWRRIFQHDFIKERKLSNKLLDLFQSFEMF